MKIEDYFISDSFYNALKPLRGKIKKENIFGIIGFLVGSLIRFVSINDFSMDEAEDYLNKLVNHISKNPNKNFELVESETYDYERNLVFLNVLKHLNITEESLSDFDIESNYIRYIIDKFRKQSFLYHAFNGVFYNSILENGLNPNIMFTPQKDLDMIHNIFMKYGLEGALGWQQINCKNKISYSLSPKVSYSYAIDSPEWFSQFCGEGRLFDSVSNRIQHTFRNNDYEGAKNNLLQLFEKYDISDEDQNTILTFFKKNWKLYASRDSYVVMIPHTDLTVNNDLLLKRSRSLNISPKQFFNINYCESGIDIQSDQVIDVSKAKFIKFPDYNKIEKFLLCDKLKANLEVLKNSSIGIKENNGCKVLYSAHSEEELKEVKQVLCDNEVFKYILNTPTDDAYNYRAWIPYFSNSILSNDENVINMYKLARTYFSYVSEEKRNDKELMKKCLINCETVDKYIIHMVGKDVLNDIEFISLLLIKIKDEDFDFYEVGEYSIDGSKMSYGKLLGRKVQTDPKFWKLLNSKIKMINKRFGLNIPLFNINKEIVIASRYFNVKF